MLGPVKWWLTRQKIVWPAFLSIGASSLPFYEAWSLQNATTVEDTGVRLAQSVFDTYLGVGLLTVSVLLFLGWDHRRAWGSIVACLFGFYGFTELAPLYFALSYSYLAPTRVLVFLAYFSVPVAGFLGGLFGIFWKTSWKKRAAVAAYAGPARLALIGGSILFLLLVPFLFYAGAGLMFLIFSSPALLVLASGVALYRTKWRPRLLGIVIVGGSLWVAVPFLYRVSQLFTYGPFFYSSLTDVEEIWAYFALAGTVIAVIGGLQSIFRKKETAKVEIPSGSS